MIGNEQIENSNQSSSAAFPLKQEVMQFPSKKISKKAEEYIDTILTKFETTKDLLNEQALNNTYSYTRQLDEKDGARRNQTRRISNEESGS